MKDELPVKLAQRGLKISESKTELNEPTVIIVRETANYLVAY